MTDAPFNNCQFRECDLPGQCRSEGKCHHPRASCASEGQASDARSISEDELSKLLPCSYYMDPPDGGSVTILEQLQRMARDAERYRWMRSKHGLGGENLDEQIDAAIEQERRK